MPSPPRTPTLVMVPPSEGFLPPFSFVHQQALVKPRSQGGLAEPALTPAADMLEPGRGRWNGTAVIECGRRGMSSRLANRDDQPPAQ